MAPTPDCGGAAGRREGGSASAASTLPPAAGPQLQLEPGWGLPRGPRALARRILEEAARGLGVTIGVRTREPVVALTFDDGPHPQDTPAMLEVLGRHGARGTFFFLGKPASRQPELVARVAAAGHAIGSHGWDHTSFALATARHRRAQLRWTADALRPHAAALFRPPYGEITPAGRLDALRCGHRVVCWDALAEDWRSDPPELLVDRVLRRLRPGSIVLLHDTLATAIAEEDRDRSAVRAAVAMLIDRLSGYRFVTVPELLRLGPPVRWHWIQRARLDWHRQLV